MVMGLLNPGAGRRQQVDCPRSRLAEADAEQGLKTPEEGKSSQKMPAARPTGPLAMAALLLARSQSSHRQPRLQRASLRRTGWDQTTRLRGDRHGVAPGQGKCGNRKDLGDRRRRTIGVCSSVPQASNLGKPPVLYGHILRIQPRMNGWTRPAAVVLKAPRSFSGGRT